MCGVLKWRFEMATQLERGTSRLIQLNQAEVKELIKQRKNYHLRRTRNHYYMNNNDFGAARIVAAMRGYDVLTFREKCIEGLYYI